MVLFIIFIFYICWLIDKQKAFIFWQTLIIAFFPNSDQFLDEPTILTIDQSTLFHIPNHLRSLITQQLGTKSPTQIDLMNAIVIASGLETGFIGDWCFNGDAEDVLTSYQLSWSYSFDRRLLIDFAKNAPDSGTDEPLKTFKFKFSLNPEHEILVHSIEGGDMLLLSSRLVDNSIVTSTRSLAFPLSRYVVHKKPNLMNLPADFRNLRELSIKLKNEIFLPMRNNIFCKTLCKRPYPSLHGITETVLLMLFRYLKRKDVVSLSMTCKSIRETAVPFLLRNKSKKD